MVFESYIHEHLRKTDLSVSQAKFKILDRQTVSYLTLTMTSTQFIEMSVTVTYNSPFQEVSHFDDPKRSSTWFY